MEQPLFGKLRSTGQVFKVNVWPKFKPKDHKNVYVNRITNSNKT